MTLSVLVVDDDFRVARLHADIVAATTGFRVAAAVPTIGQALAHLGSEPVDLALVDLFLPDGSGLDLLRRLPCEAIMLSAAADSVTVRAALAAGAVGYLIKPFGSDALRERLTAFARYRAITDRAENLTQADLDTAIRTLHAQSQHRPKGHSQLTEQAIVAALAQAAEPLSASEIAERVGVSRATAQRYLAELVDGGRIVMGLRYGTTGRPEHRYGVPAQH